MKRIILLTLAVCFLSNITVQAQSLMNQAKQKSSVQKKKTAITTKNTIPKSQTKPKTAPKYSASSNAAMSSNVVIGKGDLPLFDLHGPVKSVKMNMDFGDGTFNFDRNGRWTTWDGEPISSFAISRDKKGRVDYFANGISNSFSYANNGLLRKYTVTNTQCEITYTYSYSASGDMTSCTMSSQCSFGNSSDTYKFSILQRDAYGNWLKRKTGKNIETRTIEFYESAQNNVDDDKIYESVEEMPSFPGGMEALMKYLSSAVKYPVEAEKNGIQGRVVCTFIVEKDGSISNVQVSRSVHQALDNEAVRVINAMPRWIPGKQGGQTRRVKFTLPITFRL